MTSADYSKFMPDRYTDHMPAPTPTWWEWNGNTVHVARAVVPDAPVRVLGIHGAGGYSGALWPFAGIGVKLGAEVLFPDLPLYGDTVVADPAGVRYEQWVDLLCDLVRAEKAADDRPLVLLGASIGGLLAYEVAARTGLADAVVATCLLDPSDPSARAAAARFGPMGVYGAPLMRRTERLVGRIRVPIRWVADVANMSSNRELATLCATDPRGGGVRVPLGFLSSYFSFEHTAPEAFRTTPVLLTHPADDRWTPPELSLQFLRRINAPTEFVMLDGCGHFPVEEPGLTQFHDAVDTLLRSVAERHRTKPSSPA